MRRAHSHLYWTGAGRAVPRVRFLLPISVKGGGVGRRARALTWAACQTVRPDRRRLAAIKRFFHHLEIVRCIPNPVRKMRYPKRDRRLGVLSEKEIAKLISLREPPKTDRAGWRDRALIETMYSPGLR